MHSFLTRYIKQVFPVLTFARVQRVSGPALSTRDALWVISPGNSDTQQRSPHHLS
jgi:hypothetical protein